MELSPASKSKVIAYGILRALLIIGGVVFFTSMVLICCADVIL
jgi:hypothetical protein